MYDPFIFSVFQFLIKKGNKKKIHLIFYDILYTLKKTTRLCPFFVMKKALLNAQNYVEMVPIFERKKRGRKVNVLFYKPFIYNEKQRIKKSISFLYEHMKLLRSSFSLSDKFSICILNLFFLQGPVQDKLDLLHSCVGNVNRKKRFYIRKNHFLFSRLKKNKNRRSRGIKKGVRFKPKFKKQYSIQSICYSFKKQM